MREKQNLMKDWLVVKTSQSFNKLDEINLESLSDLYNNKKLDKKLSVSDT